MSFNTLFKIKKQGLFLTLSKDESTTTVVIYVYLYINPAWEVQKWLAFHGLTNRMAIGLAVFFHK